MQGNNLVSTKDLESPTMMPSPEPMSAGYSVPSLNSHIYAGEASPSTGRTQEHLQTLQISSKAIAAHAPDVPFLQASPSLSRATPPEIMPPPKPKIRAKIPLEKGYSQMDWLKLTQTKADLAGASGCQVYLAAAGV